MPKRKKGCLFFFLFYPPFLLSLLLFFFSGMPVSRAKPSLHQTLLPVYASARFTFFCHHPFSEKGEVTFAPCPQCPTLTSRIQWMPIISYLRLARHLPCAQEKRCFNKKGQRFKGQRCCQQVDPLYQKMKNDLHNFVPELASLKQQRKNYEFGELVFANRESIASCHFFIDKRLKIIEPAPKIRGLIARTYLYFKREYALPLTLAETELFIKWDSLYPPTAFEKEREQKIQALQS